MVKRNKVKAKHNATLPPAIHHVESHIATFSHFKSTNDEGTDGAPAPARFDPDMIASAYESSLALSVLLADASVGQTIIQDAGILQRWWPAIRQWSLFFIHYKPQLSDTVFIPAQHRWKGPSASICVLIILVLSLGDAKLRSTVFGDMELFDVVAEVWFEQNVELGSEDSSRALKQWARKFSMYPTCLLVEFLKSTPNRTDDKGDTYCTLTERLVKRAGNKCDDIVRSIVEQQRRLVRVSTLRIIPSDTVQPLKALETFAFLVYAFQMGPDPNITRAMMFEYDSVSVASKLIREVTYWMPTVNHQRLTSLHGSVWACLKACQTLQVAIRSDDPRANVARRRIIRSGAIATIIDASHAIDIQLDVAGEHIVDAEYRKRLQALCITAGGLTLAFNVLPNYLYRPSLLRDVMCALDGLTHLQTHHARNEKHLAPFWGAAVGYGINLALLEARRKVGKVQCGYVSVVVFVWLICHEADLC